MCSFRSLAAAQRFTPVSHFNLFYRNIRRKSAPDTAYSLCFCLFWQGKRRNSLKYRPRSAMLFLYNAVLRREMRKKKGSLSGRGGCHG